MTSLILTGGKVFHMFQGSLGNTDFKWAMIKTPKAGAVAKISYIPVPTQT